MGFSSPEQAALAGAGVTEQTTVLVSTRGRQHAAVLLVDPAWAGPDLTMFTLIDGTWLEGSSTTGGTLWSADSTGPEDDDDQHHDGVGTLVSWGRAQPGVRHFEVTFLGQRSLATVANGYWLWLDERVAHRDIDAPATFTPIT